MNHKKMKIIVLLVIFVFYCNSIDGREKIPVGEPTNLLELEEDENNIMIIDYEGIVELRDSVHVIHQYRVQLNGTYQDIFPILKNALSITVTESIKDSKLEHDIYYKIYEMGNLNWLEFEYPQFLEDVEEFILTIQYYTDFEEFGVISRNFWRICIHNVEYPESQGYLDRVSFILPKYAYIWRANTTLWVTTKIKKVDKIEVDVEDRIGVSWYMQEKETQCLELGFGTSTERVYWQNREIMAVQFILTFAGLFWHL